MSYAYFIFNIDYGKNKTEDYNKKYRYKSILINKNVIKIKTIIFFLDSPTITRGLTVDQKINDVLISLTFSGEWKNFIYFCFAVYLSINNIFLLQ